MTLHSLAESLISAGLGILSAMAIIAVLPRPQASVVSTILIAAAIVEIFRFYSPDAPDPPPQPAIGGDRQISTDHTDDDAVPDRDDGVDLDLDTTPLIQQHRLDTDQYPNAMIGADPTVARFFDRLPDTVGAWQESHRHAALWAPKSSDTMPLLCWVRSPDADRHIVGVQADSPELDAAYEVYYRYDDFTEDNSTDHRYMAATHHEEFDTAADAAAYALHWMQTYPDGGPGDSTSTPRIPDPADASPLPDTGATATYAVQTNPDTDTTTITQHS